MSIIHSVKEMEGKLCLQIEFIPFPAKEAMMHEGANGTPRTISENYAPDDSTPPRTAARAILGWMVHND
jgi:hypothetical protein